MYFLLAFSETNVMHHFIVGSLGILVSWIIPILIGVVHGTHTHVIATTKLIIPIAIHSEMTNKMTFSDAMEIDQEGSLETSKRNETETGEELLEVINTEGKEKKMRVKGPAFEVK